MLNVLGAGVLGLVVACFAVLSALIIHLMQKEKFVHCKTRHVRSYNMRIVKKTQGDFSAQAHSLIVGIFSNQLLASYREKMISSQPIDNDRILPGDGKEHTLSIIAAVAGGVNHSIPSVIDQVGDIFS